MFNTYLCVLMHNFWEGTDPSLGDGEWECRIPEHSPIQQETLNWMAPYVPPSDTCLLDVSDRRA